MSRRAPLDPREERGIALVIAVALTTLLVVVAGTLTALVLGESTRSRADATRDGAYQAAEAGLDAYLADLTEDPSFYLDALAKGEATRTVGGTTYVSDPNANVSWTLPATATWMYATPLTAPSSQQRWRPLGNGFEYLIKVYPISSQEVRLVTIGRPVGSSDLATYRAIETYARSLSVSDFQMLAAADVVYGPGATTRGLVYVGKDNAGGTHTLTHQGTATADLMSEGSIQGGVTMVAPARKYTPSTSPSIRSKIRNPILFSDLTASPLLAAFPTKAQTQGNLYLNPSTSPPDAWWFQFQSNGQVVVQRCAKATSVKNGVVTTYPIEYRQPTCTPYGTYPLTATGEDIYTGQDAIVSGHVNGRVTIYSNADVVIADTIDYVNPGSNVLGLIANNNVIVACWEPQDNLSWRAATLALHGRWISDWGLSPACSAPWHTSMTFTGSTGTYGGGSMGGFNTRTYNYDTTLRYLIPPDYPRISAVYTIEAQREVPPS